MQISENITPIGDGNYYRQLGWTGDFQISENITPIGDGNPTSILSDISLTSSLISENITPIGDGNQNRFWIME